MAIKAAVGVKLANKRRNAANKQRHQPSLSGKAGGSGSSGSGSKRGRAEQVSAGGADARPDKRRRTNADTARADSAAKRQVKQKHAHNHNSTNSSAMTGADDSHIDDIAQALLADERREGGSSADGQWQEEEEEGAEEEESELDSSADEAAEFDSAPRRFADQPSHSSQRMPVRLQSGQWTDSASEDKRSREMQWLNRHNTHQQPQPQQPQRPQQQHQRNAAPVSSGAGDEESAVSDSGTEAERTVVDGGSRSQSRSDRTGRSGQSAAAETSEAPQLSSDEMRRQRQRRLLRMKLEIAELADAVLQQPDTKLSLLDSLHQLSVRDEDEAVQQLAMLSEVEVLCDIIPAYRIRLPTEQEQSAKLSEETRRLWKFEQSLLSAYRRCVSHLLSVCAPSAVRVSPASFLCGVRGACRLLSKGHHFNCRKELVDCVVPLLTHRLPAVRRLSFDSVVSVFTGDEQGDATADCVRVVARLVNRKLWNVQSEMLTCLLRLPLSSQQQPVSSKKSPSSVRLELAERRKEKKRLAKVSSTHKRAAIQVDDVMLARDMAAGEAVVNAQIKAKQQTATVTHLFEAYFTLIKQPNNTRWHARYQTLMPTVMKGMERFSPLLNADVLLDLLDYLKRLIDPTSAYPLPVDVMLCCLSTLLRLTRVGHGSAVSVDLLSCARHLYAAMWLCMEVRGAPHIPLLLDCVDELCLQSRAMPPARVSAFLHRLVLLAATVQHAPLVLSALHCCHQLLLAYPACQALMDEPAVSGGRFNGEMDDCDACNGHTQPILEMCALLWSSDPAIVHAVRSLILGPNTATIPAVQAAAGTAGTAGARRTSCGQIARQLQQHLSGRTFALPPPPALIARSGRGSEERRAAAGKAKRVTLHALLHTTDFLQSLQTESAR